jgi:osmotically-inducible protein OsmY
MKKILKLMVAESCIVLVLLSILVPTTSYAKSNRNKLSDKIISAIKTSYAGTDINVTVKKDNLVMLKGAVNSLYDKYRIYDIAAKVSGVKKIADDIVVNTELVPDKIIEDNIRNTIDGSTDIKEPQRIKVDVKNSVVKLSGTVNYINEKSAALTIASQEDGVISIDNEIEVTPINEATDDKHLKNYLASVLKNNFPLINENEIKVTVQNGFVIIGGFVPDMWTKDNIEKDFESVAGVIRVVNNLEVNTDQQNL